MTATALISTAKANTPTENLPFIPVYFQVSYFSGFVASLESSIYCQAILSFYLDSYKETNVIPSMNSVKQQEVAIVGVTNSWVKLDIAPIPGSNYCFEFLFKKAIAVHRFER